MLALALGVESLALGVVALALRFVSLALGVMSLLTSLYLSKEDATVVCSKRECD